MTPTQHEQSPQEVVANFVRMLDVRAEGSDVFISEPEQRQHEEQHRLFGGLVLAQAAIAAGSTVEDAAMHSLHAYFLRGGRFDVPLTYHVERVRDGRTFKARRVLVRQGEDAICDVTTSFARHEEGIAHQDPMPDAPDPETLVDAREQFPMEDGTLWPYGPIEWRLCEPPNHVAAPGERALVREWARMRHPLPTDPVLHAAALVFASDAGSFAAIERRYGDERMAWHASASLDHAFWLHQPIFWDGWILMTTENPVAYSARALSHRAFYTHGGLHVASMTQEAVVRQTQDSA